MDQAADAALTCTSMEELLSEVLGIDPKILGRNAIEAARARYRERLGVEDDQQLTTRILSVPTELDNLIEDVVIPETWFFREPHALSLLAAEVSARFNQADCQCPLRILSAPCASGEEPFSIAIALLEAGLEPETFHIDAVDISRKAILAAREALFEKKSFRQGARSPESRWFLPVAAGYQLIPEVRKQVHFHRDNLVCPTFLNQDTKPYSFIFCRNLLIYLTQTARQKVFSQLDRHLLPGGLLFAGHAEVSLVQGFGYLPVRYPFAFACKKASAIAEVNPYNVLEKAPAKNPANKPSAGERALPHVECVPLEAPPADSGAFDAAEDFQNLLAKAWRFSNQGLLPEAASLCRRLIQLKPHHSEAQFLMGLISDAGNDYSAAEQHYLKALYLDPGHSETLLHLALFYELRGNIEQAKLYRERLARISDCDSS